MAKKTECESYTLDALRNAWKSLDRSEQDIEIGIREIAKNLIESKPMNYDMLASNFRGYEFAKDRFDSAYESYCNHQDRHGCAVPEDIDQII